MPQPFPNHLVSIPRSIVSLKHYFRVHDQGFGRTAAYGLILAILVTALTIGAWLMARMREEPKFEARLAEGLEKALAPVSFKDGKAHSDAKQPAVVTPDVEFAPAATSAPEGAKRPRERIVLLVLDTTGAVATWEKAAEVGGCPSPKRIILFGQRGFISVDTTQPQPAPQGGCGGPPPGPPVQPYVEKNLTDLRKLIEEKGGKMPVETTDTAGAAKFAVEAGKVHLVLHTPDLMVVVDATDKGLNVEQACSQIIHERPEISPPPFLVLVTAANALLKPIYSQAAITLDFEGRGELSPAIVARWIAGAARQSRHDFDMRGISQGALPGVMGTCFTLLVLALISSVGGLVVSAVLRAGFPFAQLFTMAVYAMTPAWLVALILAAAGLVGGQWGLIVPIAIGMGYTGMATYRTARELGGTAVAPAPKL